MVVQRIAYGSVDEHKEFATPACRAVLECRHPRKGDSAGPRAASNVPGQLVVIAGRQENPAQRLQAGRPPGSQDADGDKAEAEPAESRERQQVHQRPAVGPTLTRTLTASAAITAISPATRAGSTQDEVPMPRWATPATAGVRRAG
jgi:hypothetical protein